MVVTKIKPKKRGKKRKFVEIRNSLIDSLTKFPKNIDELSKDLKISYPTVKRHLSYLRRIGIVQESIYGSGRNELRLWTVRK